ncbi:DUF1799 domain-containing protein [Pseudophaeobacter sp.]|uniref:DUF1799 domain-containing protein n=1 Tax=Pseudophaeobacter sp. TaxID=1971739 RepID=UPI003456A9BD
MPADSLTPPENNEGVWECNLPAVEAFFDAATQFKRIGLADGSTRSLGLDYGGARAAWDLAGVEMNPELFGQVQIIEHGALAEWNGN